MMSPTARRSTPRTPPPARVAFVPCMLGAIVLLAGLALVGGDWYTLVRYVSCILALIVAVFAVQGRNWWWLIGLVPIAVVWNPVFPIAIDDLPLRLLHILAAAFLVACGIFLRTPASEQRG